MPLKLKNAQTITDEVWNILTTSKQLPLKIVSNRRAEFYNSIFQKSLKIKKKNHYSRFTDEGPSIAERYVI